MGVVSAVYFGSPLTAFQPIADQPNTRSFVGPLHYYVDAVLLTQERSKFLEVELLAICEGNRADQCSALRMLGYPVELSGAVSDVISI